MTRATPTRAVSFDWPPRVGHHPGVLDGRAYANGWRYRRDFGKGDPLGRVGESVSYDTGWFDADTAIRLGRDIGQRSEG